MTVRARWPRMVLALIAVLAIFVVAAGPVFRYVSRGDPAYEMLALKIVDTGCASENWLHSIYGRFVRLEELVAQAPEDDRLIRHLKRGSNGTYQFKFQLHDAGFSVSAWPEQWGKTGRRGFYCDQTGITRQNWNGKADASSGIWK